MKRKAIFLDKDGTLIPDIPYNVDPELICISKSTIQGLTLLRGVGYVFIVITNQSGIARGYFSPDALTAVFNKIGDILAEQHIAIEKFYYCPHHPDGPVKEFSHYCQCRKPMPGLLLQAAHDLNIDLTNSWMIGDILNDVEAGNRAGCRTVLIDNGNETEWADGNYRRNFLKAMDIREAASKIISWSQGE